MLGWDCDKSRADYHFWGSTNHRNISGSDNWIILIKLMETRQWHGVISPYQNTVELVEIKMFHFDVSLF